MQSNLQPTYTFKIGDSPITVLLDEVSNGDCEFMMELTKQDGSSAKSLYSGKAAIMTKTAPTLNQLEPLCWDYYELSNTPSLVFDTSDIQLEGTYPLRLKLTDIKTSAIVT